MDRGPYLRTAAPNALTFATDRFGRENKASYLLGSTNISISYADYMPALAAYNNSIGTNWNHITIVYDNKRPHIYLNGQLVRTGLLSPRTNVYPPHLIGGSAYGYFKGLIDDVFIYNRALTLKKF